MVSTQEQTWDDLVNKKISLIQGYSIPGSTHNFYIPGSVPFLFHQKLRDELSAQISYADQLCILLTGYPGCGKTVLAHNVVYTLRKKKPSGGYFPVHAELNGSMSAEEIMGRVLSSFCDEIRKEAVWWYLPKQLQEQIISACNRTFGSESKSNTNTVGGTFKAGSASEFKMENESSVTFTGHLLGGVSANIELGRLLREINHLNYPFHPVFILDEFDKIAPEYLIKLFSELLSMTKTLMSSCKSCFIFIGGPVLNLHCMHQSKQIDDLSKDLFDKQIYLPCSWTLPTEFLDRIVNPDCMRLIHNTIQLDISSNSHPIFSSDFSSPIQQFANSLLFEGKGRIKFVWSSMQDFFLSDTSSPCLFINPYRADRIIRNAQNMEYLRKFMDTLPTTDSPFLRDVKCCLYFHVLDYAAKAKQFLKKDLLRYISSNDNSVELNNLYAEHLDDLLDLLCSSAFGHLKVVHAQGVPDVGTQTDDYTEYCFVSSALKDAGNQNGEDTPSQEDLDNKFRNHLNTVLQQFSSSPFNGLHTATNVKNTNSYHVYSVLDSNHERVHVRLHNQVSQPVSPYVELLSVKSPYLLERTDYVCGNELLASICKEPEGIPFKQVMHGMKAKDIYLFISQLLNLTEQLHGKNIFNIGIHPDNLMLYGDAIRLVHLNHSSMSNAVLFPYDSMYSAPETKNRIPTKKADYYSIGMILLHVLVNETPDLTEDICLTDMYLLKRKRKELKIHIQRMADLLQKMTHPKDSYRLCQREEILKELKSALNIKSLLSCKTPPNSTVSVHICQPSNTATTEDLTPAGTKVGVLTRNVTKECFKLTAAMFRIGAGDDANCKLTDLGVADVHADITHTSYQYTITGKGSVTLVNGKCISNEQTCPLKDGDCIQIGDEILMFNMEVTVPSLP